MKTTTHMDSCFHPLHVPRTLQSPDPYLRGVLVVGRSAQVHLRLMVDAGVVPAAVPGGGVPLGLPEGAQHVRHAAVT